MLPIFEVGDDGLARARLPFEAHMAILDDLLDTDHDALWSAASCPVWLVACAASAGRDVVDAELAAGKEASLQRAGRALARPRLLRWQGALHDVPLQWPALVAGLVRAAHDETVQSSPTREGDRA